MAYGQTGTGKTHTILGKRDGLLPKSLEYIFHKNNHYDERFVVDISCLQIYMENLTDLFDFKNKSIQIREKNGTFVVTNSTWVRLNNYDEAIRVIEETENRRKSCSTNMNQFSSRSHAIFIIKVTNIKNLTSSNLFLVDLAGSERIKKSYAQGDRLDEAISINTSLMALSKCIYGISENKWNHIPYRESKLTKILQETLAGNGKTVIIITISPDHLDIEETISSLKFGQRASKIYCMPKICKIENDYLTNNMFILDDQKKILEEENIHLREQCKKLLKIVETTSSKSKNRDPKLSEVECQEISKDLNSFLDADFEEQPIAYSEYQRVLEENKELKIRIDEVELEAFDNMRLTYEEIENNLYNEINEHKQTNKKQQKIINSLTKKLEQSSKELEEKKLELKSIKRSEVDESKSSIKSSSTQSFTEGHGDGSSLLKRTTIDISSEQPELQTLQLSIASLFEEFNTAGKYNIDEVKSKICNLLQPKETKNQSMSLQDKENILSTSQSHAEESASNNSSSHHSPVRKVLLEKKSANSRESQILKVSIASSPKVFELEEEYQSATIEQKQDATCKLLKVLEGLILDIDNKCSSITSTTLREPEALENVIQKFTTSLSCFVSHSSFKSIVEEVKGCEVSILKVAVNIIIENFVKRMVALRFAEKKVGLLREQNIFLKEIVFAPSIRDKCLEVIRNKHLVNKSARSIQRAFKKYKWRKAYAKTQKPAGMFDWGRVRAAMGKENLQILLQDVENVMETIQKNLSQ